MKIGIIGKGRFGNLLANTLKTKTSNQVFVYDKISELNNNESSSLNAVCNCEVIIPCVPISEFESTIKQIAPLLKKDSLVIDICSVKVFPTQILLKHLSEDVDIFSTHPMFGPDSTNNGQNFDGLNFIFSKTRIKNEDRFNKIMKFLKSLDLNLIEMTPDEHDKQAAFTQAFAFLIGKIGIKLAVRANQISTKGFQGILYNQLSVENDTGVLFKDMQNFNPYSRKMRRQFKKALNQIEQELNN